MKKTANYWLVKSEPDCFSIQDLAAAANQTTCWDGVRNYQARNILRDDMKLGDGVLFYHSSTSPPHVAGTAVVVKEGYPDHTAWDKKSDHYDAKSTPEAPRWYMVDIKLESVFDEPIPLERLRRVKALEEMVLLQRGSRLSVQPVTRNQFHTILKLARGG